MSRNVKLTARVSEEEAQKIKENAIKAGITVSEFLRSSALNIKIKQKQCDELKMIVYEINKIGNNLNQIARKINSDRDIDIEALERLKNIEYALYLLLDNVVKEREK